MFHVKHFVFMEILIISHYVKRLSTRFPQLLIIRNVSRETLLIICKTAYIYELCEAVIHNNSTIVDNSGILVENL